MIVGNESAEKAIIAGLFKYGQKASIDCSDIITPNSFINDVYQSLYITATKILESSTTIDMASIISSADGLGIKAIIIPELANIQRLFDYPVHLENIRTFAKQVAKLEFIRKAKATLNNAANQLSTFDGTESITDIISIPEDSVFELIDDINSRDGHQSKLLGDGTLERINHLFNNPVEMIGIPTPWPIYNNVIGGGIRPGVNLIIARPKVGKSQMLLNCAIHCAKNLSMPVLYIDTEMSQEEQEVRALAHLTKINSYHIETGSCGKDVIKKNQVLQAAVELDTLQITHEWVGGKNFEEILSIMRRWIYAKVGFDDNGNTNPHIIIYDYFKLMNDSKLDKMQEYQAIGFQVSKLSDFCKRYGSPCLSAAQSNRDGISKDTTAIISMSDRLLWLCTSCVVFKKKEAEEIVEDGRKNGNRKLIVLETRFGPGMDFNNYINLEMDGSICHITEINTKYEVDNNKASKDGFEISTEQRADTSDAIFVEHRF